MPFSDRIGAYLESRANKANGQETDQQREDRESKAELMTSGVLALMGALALYVGEKKQAEHERGHDDKRSKRTRSGERESRSEHREQREDTKSNRSEHTRDSGRRGRSLGGKRHDETADEGGGGTEEWVQQDRREREKRHRAPKREVEEPKRRRRSKRDSRARGSVRADGAESFEYVLPDKEYLADNRHRGSVHDARPRRSSPGDAYEYRDRNRRRRR